MAAFDSAITLPAVPCGALTVVPGPWAAEVFRGSDDGTLSLTPEQLAGWSSKVPVRTNA